MAANDTTATLTAEIKTTYDKLMLDRAVPQLVHTQLGQKRTIPVGGGRSIEFRRLNKKTVSTTALTEGTTPSVTSLSITTVTATVSQYGAVVTGSDWLETMAIDPILAEISEMLGEDAGDTLDQVCRDILVAGTNIRYASTATSRGGVASGMVMTATEIRKAVRGLKAANARPFRNNKFGCLLHPKILGRIAAKLCGKLREFGETLLAQTIPSQAFQFAGMKV